VLYNYTNGEMPVVANWQVPSQNNTRNAAVVRKRTTAVYAEGGRNPLFKSVSQWQKYVRIDQKAKTAAAAAHLPFC